MTKHKYFSEQQLVEFHRDGYLLVRGMFDPQQMKNIAAWTDEVVGFPEVPGRHMAYYEDSLLEPGKRVLSRIENFSPYHRGFQELFNRTDVLQSISELFGEPAILFKEKINFKMPGSEGFKAHQDVQAGWDVYGSLHITMLVSIDEATAENGCLELAPGAHKNGLIGEMWKPLPEDEILGIEYVSCPTRPGDVVFFDSFIPHRSAANLTDRARRVLYITYGRLSEGDHREQYYADKRKSYPPDCEREPGKQYVFRV